MAEVHINSFTSLRDLTGNGTVVPGETVMALNGKRQGLFLAVPIISERTPCTGCVAENDHLTSPSGKDLCSALPLECGGVGGRGHVFIHATEEGRVAYAAALLIQGDSL